MVHKPSTDNELNDSPADEAPQGQEWTTLPIALSPDMKRDFAALSRRKHLAPSQYGRLLIAEAIERDKTAV